MKYIITLGSWQKVSFDIWEFLDLHFDLYFKTLWGKSNTSALAASKNVYAFPEM